jgi:site-specific recombinase XerD
MNIQVYRRHTRACDHRSDKYYKRCECPIWFEANVMGRRFETKAERWVKTPNRESIQNRWSSHERNWGVAERQARLLEQQYDDIESGKTTQQPDAKTVAQAIELFLANKRGENLAADSLYRHEHVTASLLKFCDDAGVLLIKDVTLDVLTSWRGQWTVQAPQARRSRQEKVRNFFKFCLGAGMIATNPAAQMSVIKVKNDSDAVRVFEPKEYDQVIAATGKTTMTPGSAARIKALMQLQRYSGLSLVDAVCLSKDELQRTSGEFRVACDRQKTGTHVSNWIPTWLGQELLKVKNGNPEFFFWSGMTTPEDAPSYFQKLYRKVFKAAGVEGSSHNFRHTYAVELLKSGVDIRTVSKALGHKSLQVTERFYAKWNRAQQDKMDDTLRTALG